MIPNSHALVAQRPEQQAAVQAIVYVEGKLDRDKRWKWYSTPYAKAFLRILTGSSRVSGKTLNQIMGIHWCREEKIPLSRYEQALDEFIRSRGRYCPLPLPSDLAGYVFPEVLFSERDRCEKRWKRESEQYSRQQQRLRQEKETRYQNLVGRAEIDLAFQTPDSLRAWYQRWSQHDIRGSDLSRMLWSWLERCPSLGHIERWIYAGEPAWVLEATVRDTARTLTEEQRALESWLVPNKITLREVWP